MFCSILLNKIHPISDGNRRTCKIIFLDDDKKIIYETKIKKN